MMVDSTFFTMILLSLGGALLAWAMAHAPAGDYDPRWVSAATDWVSMVLTFYVVLRLSEIAVQLKLLNWLLAGDEDYPRPELHGTLQRIRQTIRRMMEEIGDVRLRR